MYTEVNYFVRTTKVVILLMNTREEFKNQVLEWVKNGVSKAEIARQLGISRSLLSNKLHLNQRIDADLYLRFKDIQNNGGLKNSPAETEIITEEG